MAYMRDPYYVWQDGEYIHISLQGDDTWDKIRLPLETFDELCAMRWAQLSDVEQRGAQLEAVEKWSGNFGCDALRKELGLPSVMEAAIRNAKKLRRKKP